MLFGQKVPPRIQALATGPIGYVPKWHAETSVGQDEIEVNK
jgi:hypothetical protein